LKAEIRQRIPLHPKRKRIFEQAINDSYMLLGLAFAGISTSRDDMVGIGMSERRWRWAMPVLYRAGLRNKAGVWTVTDIDEARRSIDEVRRRAETSGEYRWLFGDR
jgi:hypothetical protein